MIAKFDEMFVFFQVIINVLIELVSLRSFVFLGFVWMIDDCNHEFTGDFQI